jgi:dihydroorotase
MREPPALTAFINVRLIDPATGYDGPGEVLIGSGEVLAAGPNALAEGFDENTLVIDGDGHALMPGLVDLRVSCGEPGSEHRETIKTVGRAAVAGGVTTIVMQPDTNPVIDDAALVDFVLRRGRDRSLARMVPAGALTKGLDGQTMAEIGLMAEAGAALFSNGSRAISDSRVMRRLLSYATGFDALVSVRPEDPWLSQGGCMNEGELAARLGVPSIPAAAEHIYAQRDLALAELTGGRLLLDMISSAGTLPSLARAKEKGLDVSASVSIHNLTLNETDVGDYRTFAKLSPPLRSEEDRIALIDAVRSGLVDVIVSGHDPRPAEEKRLPFDEASFGASALEVLLPAALTLWHEGSIELIDLVRAMTQKPADLLDMGMGRLTPGAPADLILVDLGYPFIFDADKMRSKCKNSPYDGRRMQGRVLSTWVAGTKVFDAQTGFVA